MTDSSTPANAPTAPGEPRSSEASAPETPEVPAVPGLRFVTRGVTPTEAAAVSAVLHGLVREESDHLRQAPVRGQSAWQRSQRSIRVPLTPGPGRWRGFSA
ncbi:acyl-CoA carboxylase subunit epsilon [Cryobacterium cheniae]|uniref:Acyl-CoA carboxylase subunit epsilon n=1 Tax=Cryobacterium cheniae TaxID=1259262 RepID=A0A4R8XLF3_9MICO|nr:acyl-CoA carboxylase subunit epsilon [Cryobacterium cheniae]TFC78974.1 acyl-CoA carboxylase subunit epsilon [Cryobacterium cheniae]